MNDKQKNFLSVVGICLFLLFVVVFAGDNQQAISPMITTEKAVLDKKMVDLGTTFEEFIEKYNNVAVKNKSKYSLNSGNIKKQGTYYLSSFAYATMKIGIDEKTKNVSYVEVYGEYSNKISKDEKNALLIEQKKLFEIASEVFDEKLQGQDKSQQEKEYILRHDLEYWKGNAVTLIISAKKIPHISCNTEELPDKSSATSDIDYLAKGFWWMDANGDLHPIYKKVKIRWEGRSIILSNGDKAYQFSFLEGAYAGEFGYWSSSFQ